MTGSAGVIDFFSLVVSCYLVPMGGGPDILADAPADWRNRVAGTLASFRTPDGGYGKTPGAPFGSTYTSFLVALCLQLLDRPIPAPDRLTEFVRIAASPGWRIRRDLRDEAQRNESHRRGHRTPADPRTRSTTHRVWGPPSSLPHFHRSSRAACAPTIASRRPTCSRRSPAAGRSTNSARPAT